MLPKYSFGKSAQALFLKFGNELANCNALFPTVCSDLICSVECYCKNKQKKCLILLVDLVQVCCFSSFLDVALTYFYSLFNFYFDCRF